MYARRALVVVLAGCCAALVPLATGQEKSWVGELVLPTKRAADIRFGDRVDGKEISFPYKGTFPQKVRDERDGRLRIHDGNREGWVDKGDFVLGRDGAAFFHRRVVANPRDIDALLMRGSGWLQKLEFDNAIQDFNECIRLAPTDPSAYNSRGNAYLAKKEYDKAIKDYDEAVRLEPKHVLAVSNRGRAYFDRKEYDKAIEDYTAANRLDPMYTRPLSDRGYAYLAKKEYDKAIKDYNEVLRLDPMDAAVWAERALAWRTQKEYDKAIMDCSEALRLDPKNAVVLVDRAWCFSGKGEHDRAIKDCDEAIAVNPKYGWAHHIRATAKMLSRRRDALDGFQQVIAIEGGKGILSPYAVIMGYFTLRHAGDAVAAKNFLKEFATKLDEAWPHSVVKFLHGELDEAALLERATDNDKQTVARCFLGMDHAVNGRHEKALAHLRWVKDHGNTTWVQYAVAVAELSRLERGQ